MPEAPTNPINSEGPQVQPGAGFTPNVSPDAFGAGIGRALEGVGHEAMHFAMYEKRYHDQESVQGISQSIEMHRLRLLQDPQIGLTAQNFSDPDELHAATEKARSDFQAAVAQEQEGATNDHQRALLSRTIKTQTFDFNRQVDAYALGQQRQISTRQLKTGLELAKINAASSVGAPAVDPATGYPPIPGEPPANPPPPDGTPPRSGEQPTPAPLPADRSEQIIQDHLRQIQTVMQHQGASKDDITAAQAQATNQLRSGVIQSLISKDPQQAADYFQKHQGDLFPQEQERFAAATKNVLQDQRVNAKVGALMYDENGRPREPEDVHLALAKDRELLADPKLFERVKTTVDQHLDLAKQAQNEIDTKTNTTLWNALSQYGGDLTALRKAYPGAIESLPPTLQRELAAGAKNVAEGRKPEDSSDAFYSLSRMSGTDRDAFAKTDLRQYRSVLSDKDYRELIGRQEAALGKENPTGTRGINIASSKEQILKDAGLGGEDDDAKRARRLADRSVEANGGWEKVGTGGYQKIIDSLVLDTAKHVDRAWYNPRGWTADTKVPAYKNMPAGYAFGIQQVPEDQLDLQRKKALANGVKEPTDQQLVDAYNASLSHAGP